jgi:P27 family predicted phage terminase small subunit
MAIRGGKPTPTSIKLLTGNPGQRPLQANEPKPKSRKPTAPAHLNDDAKDEWARIADELDALGILSGLDRAALGAYCQAYGRWAQAERALSKMKNQADGLIIKTISGNMIQNPLVGVANKAMADMVRYAAEFGMTPSARSRISASEPGDDDPANEYLN